MYFEVRTIRVQIHHEACIILKKLHLKYLHLSFLTCKIKIVLFIGLLSLGQNVFVQKVFLVEPVDALLCSFCPWFLLSVGDNMFLSGYNSYTVKMFLLEYLEVINITYLIIQMFGQKNSISRNFAFLVITLFKGIGQIFFFFGLYYKTECPVFETAVEGIRASLKWLTAHPPQDAAQLISYSFV